MVDKHLVHPPEPDLGRGVVGGDTRAGVEDELVACAPAIHLVVGIVAPPHLHKNTHFRLCQPHGQGNHRAHERDPHFVGGQRGQWIKQRQFLEIGITLGGLVGGVLRHHAVEHRHRRRARRPQPRQSGLRILPRHPIAQARRGPLHRVMRARAARVNPTNLPVTVERGDLRLPARHPGRQRRQQHHPCHMPH